jgi:hypothetical protein
LALAAGTVIAMRFGMMTQSRSFFLLPFAVLAALAGAAACSSSHSDDCICDAIRPSDSGTDGSDAGSDAPAADCGAIELLPPVIIVESASGDSIPCDATFTLLRGSDGGATSDPGLDVVACNSLSLLPSCPPPTNDSGAACTYVVLGLAGEKDPVTIQVTQSGFDPSVASDVHGGVGGCASPVAPSSTIVKLQPTAGDAGVDGH